MIIKGSADHKQHVNLSAFAMEVIRYDMMAFMHSESLSGFLNAVFERYYEYADASVSLACDRYASALRQTLSSVLVKDGKLDAVVNCLVKDKGREILEKVRGYAVGAGVKFRLNNTNFAFLYPEEQPDDEVFHFPEDSSYSTVGKYVKAVLEEYCEKSMFEREEIFFHDMLTQIKHSIEGNTLLKIRLESGWYELKPYSVEGDSSKEYHYLIGLAYPIARSGQKAEDPFYMSVRLPQIMSLEPKTYRSGKLSEHQRQELRELIQQKGVQFLKNEQDRDIVVRMTPAGVHKYKRMLHLRPRLISHEEYEGYSIFRFHCSPLQARFYLFRLGGDTYVLDPPELREALHERFAEAHAMYSMAPEELEWDEEDLTSSAFLYP